MRPRTARRRTPPALRRGPRSGLSGRPPTRPRRVRYTRERAPETTDVRDHGGRSVAQSSACTAQHRRSPPRRAGARRAEGVSMIGTRARSQAPPAPRPPLRRLPPWWPAAAVAALLWTALAVCILAQRLFVSNDSLSTYAHVWWIADSIWDHGRLPFAMPVLNHGNGHAFPYGAPAWTVAALL